LEQPGDTGCGVSYYEASVNDGAPFTVSSPYHPTWTEGTYTFKVRAVDGVGLQGGWSNVITIRIDITPPSGSISINAGATYATSTSVTLALSATDAASGVAQMRFSNDGSSWTNWESYAMARSWTLASGDGTKTVYVQFKDNADLISSSYSDTIVLDTAFPSPPTLLSPPNAANVSRRPTFVWSPAIDATSGISSYTFQLDTSLLFNSSKLIIVAGIITTYYTPDQLLEEGTWYWRVCATDNAGNVGPYSTPLSINVSPLTGLGGDIQTVFAGTDPVGFMTTGNIYDDSGIGFIIGHRAPPKLFFTKTDATYVNPTTGVPTWSGYTHLVTVGGRNANPTTRYDERKISKPLRDHPKDFGNLVS